MKRHLEVLKYCRWYFNKNHKFPLLMEIADNFDITKEAARQNLNRLVTKGYLAKHGWEKRGYTLLVKDIYPKEDNLISKVIRRIKGRQIN